MFRLNLLVFMLVLSTGNCLECHSCYEAFEGPCYSGGNLPSNQRSKCKTGLVCVTYQYRITRKGSFNSYVTTVRGCDELNICEKLMHTKVEKSSTNSVQEGVLCETCNTTDFCNGVVSYKQTTTVFVPFVFPFCAYILYTLA